MTHLAAAIFGGGGILVLVATRFADKYLPSPTAEADVNLKQAQSGHLKETGAATGRVADADAVSKLINGLETAKKVGADRSLLEGIERKLRTLVGAPKGTAAVILDVVEVVQLKKTLTSLTLRHNLTRLRLIQYYVSFSRTVALVHKLATLYRKAALYMNPIAWLFLRKHDVPSVATFDGSPSRKSKLVVEEISELRSILAEKHTFIEPFEDSLKPEVDGLFEEQQQMLSDFLNWGRELHVTVDDAATE